MVGIIPLQSATETALANGINNVWVLVVSFLIFFMQPGFAMLEAGQVRAKNVGNVLMKNMTDWGLGVIVYFLIGTAVVGIVGALTTSGVAISDPFSTLGDASAVTPGTEAVALNGWVSFLFGAVFAMTAATIVSGAVAGRMKFSAYVLFVVAMVGLIYPVLPGFAWGGSGLLSGDGFLGDAIGVGYLDFAGATVVHMAGGLAGLVAAKMVGPRKGRYDANGNAQPIPGHSVLFAVLGTLILAFGWYGFNVGTQATIVTFDQAGEVIFNGAALGRVALVTTLGMGGGGVAAMAVSAYWQGKPDPLWTANGVLAGLVGVTGAVPHVHWAGGLAIGLLVGALVLPTFRWTVDTLKIDDVCGVFAVHGAAGGIGTILIPVVGSGTGGGYSFLGVDQLIMQVVGVAVVGTWTVLATMAILGIIGALVGLRVSEEEEERGLDISEHGVSTYPEFGQDSGPVTADGGTEVTHPDEVRTDGGDQHDSQGDSDE